MTDVNSDDDDKKVDDAEAGESNTEDNQTDDSDNSDGDQGTNDDSKDDSKSDSKSDDDDVEPKKRMSVKDHIIQRKAKSYDKIKSKDKSDDDSKDDDDDGDAGLSDKARGAISKELDPVLDLVQRQEDERELQDVFTRFPDAKDMEKSIRKHMEAYPDAPVEFIYNALAGKRSRLNAKRADADKKADGDRTGGHNKRPKDSGTGLKNADELSEEEFDKVVSKTLSSQ